MTRRKTISAAAVEPTLRGVCMDASLKITASTVDTSPDAPPIPPPGGLDTPGAGKTTGGSKTGEKPPMPTFQMSAYNGGPMRLSGYDFPVVVDLDGLTPAKANTAIRVGHDEWSLDNILGETDTLKIEDGSLVATGRVTCGPSSDTCKQAMDLAANGFHFQASINAIPTQLEFVRSDTSTEVNGKIVAGPAIVARAATLTHIALVPLGADTSTSASIAANAAKEKVMEFAAWLRATYQMDPATLTATQESAFKAEFGRQAHPAPVVAAAAVVTTPVVAAVDTEAPVKAMRASMAAESERIAAVQTTAKDHPAIAAQAIRDGWSNEKTELEVLRASRKPETPAGSTFGINTGVMPEIKPTLQIAASSGGRHSLPDLQADNRARIIEAKALMSAGYDGNRLAKDGAYGQDVLNYASDARITRQFGRQLGPIGIFKMAAEMAGIRLPDKSNQSEFFGVLKAEFSTMTLPVILSNLMNKFLLDGYYSVDPDHCDPNATGTVAWKKFVRTGPLQDFKPHFRLRLVGSVETQPLGPGGEIQHGQLLEQSYSIRARTRAIMLAITREAIINDDLSAMSTVPTHLGVGHGRSIAKMIYATLLNNMQSDMSTAFFTSSAITTAGNAMAKNLNTSNALAYAALATARANFALQTDPTGAPFGQVANIMLIPPGLISTAMSLYAPDALIPSSITSGTAVLAPSKQALAGLYKPVCSSWLANCPAMTLEGGVAFTGAAGADLTSWYLFCNPANAAYAMEAGFLNGQEAPIVERAEAEFDTLGIAFRGFGDFGVSMAEPRAAQKNNA